MIELVCLYFKRYVSKPIIDLFTDIYGCKITYNSIMYNDLSQFTLSV